MQERRKTILNALWIGRQIFKYTSFISALLFIQTRYGYIIPPSARSPLSSFLLGLELFVFSRSRVVGVDFVFASGVVTFAFSAGSA